MHLFNFNHYLILPLQGDLIWFVLMWHYPMLLISPRWGYDIIHF